MGERLGTVAFASVGFAVLLSGLWLWINVIARKAAQPKAPLVPWSERRPVAWGLVDLLLLVAIWVAASLTVSSGLRQLGLAQVSVKMEQMEAAERQAVLVGNLLTSAAILGLGLPLIAFRTGATPRDLGWSGKHFWKDVKLGLVGFVLLAPPVYALQGLLTQVWKPSKHPLVEMFKGAPNFGFFMLLFLSAAIVAPLFEELIFRVLWQGWLEECFSRKWRVDPIFGGSFLSQRSVDAHSALNGTLETSPIAESPDEGTLEADLAQLENPYAPPRALEGGRPAATDGIDSHEELRGFRAALPIVVSSSVFALLHYSHGPDWIPLLLLAAGMGYLYQRTHRLVPSLTVHCLLNSYSLWGLWLQMHSKDFGS